MVVAQLLSLSFKCMAQYIQKQTKKQNPAYQVQEDVDFVKSNKIPPGNT